MTLHSNTNSSRWISSIKNEREEADSTTNVAVEKSDYTTYDSSKLQPVSTVTVRPTKEGGSDQRYCYPVLLSCRKSVKIKAFWVAMLADVINRRGANAK